MDKYDIYFNDWMRILQGAVPWAFYIELIIRALACYLIIVIALRLMGKRMGKLLTRNELAAISTLAAAIGIPLQTPDRGLLPGVLIAGVVVLMQRTVAGISTRNQKFERLTQGRISTLVSESVLQMDAMKETHLTREHIFSKLRGSNIRHLGEVQRLYLEANGSFTLIKKQETSPGLCVLPQADKAYISEQTAHADKKICAYCGNAQQSPATHNCSNCNYTEWVDAIS